MFHPHSIPAFEVDSTTVEALTSLHSFLHLHSSLSALCSSHSSSVSSSLVQANAHLTSVLTPLIPSLALSPEAEQLVNLSLHLSPHTPDPPTLLAALLSHLHSLSPPPPTPSPLLPTRSVRKDLRVMNALMESLGATAGEVAASTALYLEDVPVYRRKVEEYEGRTKAVGGGRGREGEDVGVDRVVRAAREAEMEEGRLRALRAEVETYGGLACDVRQARRQVEEAELEVRRMEDDIERRLREMSAFDASM